MVLKHSNTTNMQSDTIHVPTVYHGFVGRACSSFARLVIKDSWHLSVFIFLLALCAALAIYGSTHHLQPLTTRGLADQQPTSASTLSAAGSNNSQRQSQTSSKNGNTDSSEDTATNRNSTSVTVNGQPVNVPQNGSYSETIKTSDGQTTISGSNSHSSNSTHDSASNYSSTTVNIDSR